jgi:hypothetical protein
MEPGAGLAGATADELRGLLQLAEHGSYRHNWNWLVAWANGKRGTIPTVPGSYDISTATPGNVLRYFQILERNYRDGEK